MRALVNNEKLSWPITTEETQLIAEGAARRTSSAASFAFDLMLEYEMAHGPPGDQMRWLAPLTGGVGLQLLADQIPGLSAAIARAHLASTWRPIQATTVNSLAAIAGVRAANKLFERYHTRVLLLPFITHAFLCVRGAFSRTVAYELYTRAGLAGEDARTAYGAHKEPGHARAGVIGGLAPLTGDTVTPVSMFPVVHGTWDDPEHPSFQARQRHCDAAPALRPFGLRPDGSIAAFASYQFELLQQARAIVEHAAQHGSKTCQSYGINPKQMLDWAMPNRVVIGKLAVGASATNGTITDVLLLPGLNAELLRAANAHRIEILAYALDHMTDYVASLQPQLNKLAIADAEDYFHGPELTDMLTGNARWALPGLDEMSSAALDVIGNDALAGHSGVTINSDTVQYFRVQRARLKDTHGLRLVVNLLARVRASDMVVWSTPQTLTGAGANLPVLTSELQLGAELASNASIMLCLDRFFTTFTPHKAQPSALTTRAYMYVQIMIANQGTVAHIRSQQARHPTR